MLPTVIFAVIVCDTILVCIGDVIGGNISIPVLEGLKFVSHTGFRRTKYLLKI